MIIPQTEQESASINNLIGPFLLIFKRSIAVTEENDFYGIRINNISEFRNYAIKISKKSTFLQWSKI